MNHNSTKQIKKIKKKYKEKYKKHIEPWRHTHGHECAIARGGERATCVVALLLIASALPCGSLYLPCMHRYEDMRAARLHENSQWNIVPLLLRFFFFQCEISFPEVSCIDFTWNRISVVNTSCETQSQLQVNRKQLKTYVEFTDGPMTAIYRKHGCAHDTCVHQ